MSWSLDSKNLSDSVEYYEVQSDDFFERGIFHRPQLPDGVYLNDGKPLSVTPRLPLIYSSNCDTEHPPRHCMGGGMPVWSDELVEMVRSAGVDNFQAFAAEISGRNAQVWNGYNAINVCSQVERYREPGQTTFWRPGFVDVLEISRGQVGDLELFWLGHGTVVMSKRLIAHLKENSPSEGWGIWVLRPVTVFP